MATLTDRQSAVLKFISSQSRRGRVPTVREIADHFGIKSCNGVACHLWALERKGVIKRERGARNIRIVGRHRKRTAIEQQLLDALEQCVAFINRIQKDDLPTIQEYRELQEVAYVAINAAGDNEAGAANFERETPKPNKDTASYEPLLKGTP